MEKFLKALVVVGLALALSMCIVSCDKQEEPHYEMLYSRELDGFAISTMLKGEYFLVVASVSEEPFYNFNEIGADGSHYNMAVPVSDLVYYTDLGPGEAPYVEYWECVSESGHRCKMDETVVPETLRWEPIPFVNPESPWRWWAVHLPNDAEVPLIGDNLIDEGK